jgi:hypothetical protein
MTDRWSPSVRCMYVHMHACSATISRATEQSWPAYKSHVLGASFCWNCCTACTLFLMLKQCSSLVRYNAVHQSLMSRQQQSIWTTSSEHFTLVMHKKQERTPLYMHFPPKSSTDCIKLMVSIKIARVGGDTLLSLSRTGCKMKWEEKDPDEHD